MVNKTFLPMAPQPAATSKPLQNRRFPLWHGIRSASCEPRLGRVCGSTDPHGAWESKARIRCKRGAPPMENMLLIGLSRQMTLERQMDVVANNVANVNTTGYKADRSLFQEYLGSGAREDDFKGGDRRVSYVVDRATWHDFSQ